MVILPPPVLLMAPPEMFSTPTPPRPMASQLLTFNIAVPLMLLVAMRATGIVAYPIFGAEGVDRAAAEIEASWPLPAPPVSHTMNAGWSPLGVNWLMVPPSMFISPRLPPRPTTNQFVELMVPPCML